MHAVTNNNNSQRQLQMPNDRKDAKMISPIRESLIQNAGHFILGNQKNASNSNVGGVGNDTSILGGSYPRERSEERRPLGNGNLLGSDHHKKEKDALDDFLRPNIPAQQQLQIQMLSGAQQKAYISQHRAETGIKN